MLTLLLGLAVLLLAASILPFFPIAHGIVRAGDFPRQQIAVIALAGMALSLPLGTLSELWPLLACFGLVLAIQAVFILPFTPLWRKQSLPAAEGAGRGEAVRLLACNVKQSNRDHEPLKRLIAQHRPDIVLLVETDKDWVEALKPALSAYPAVVEEPRDNTYGMILASAFALDDIKVRDLLTDGVPSITCTVKLSPQRSFRLFCLHPEPPVPYADSVGRDAEIAVAAKLAAEEEGPLIVAGDLNDVGWSRPTRRFQRLSGLLDPRIGRGFFNTFDARYPPLRWPLDHLFHSGHFRLISMRRLSKIGSDHFPVLFELELAPEPAGEDRVGEQRDSDGERADELIAEARRRDDGPIGEDWED